MRRVKGGLDEVMKRERVGEGRVRRVRGGEEYRKKEQVRWRRRKGPSIPNLSSWVFVLRSLSAAKPQGTLA